MGITLCLLPIPKAPIQPFLKFSRRYLPTLSLIPHLDRLVIPLLKIIKLYLSDFRASIVSLVILAEQRDSLVGFQLLIIFPLRPYLMTGSCLPFTNAVAGTNRSTGYDAMTCYMSIVFVRYMIISLEKRNNTDWRTTGEMFFLLCEEVSDISLTNALTILIEVMMVSIKEFFGLSEERINEFYNLFVSKLPDYIKKTLCVSEDSAVA